MAQVYLELLGGDEPSMLGNTAVKEKHQTQNFVDFSGRTFHQPRIFALSEEEEKAHREFLEAKVKSSIWLSDESTGTDN